MALASIEAAWRAGARVVALADTNGGTPPHEVYRITAEAKQRFSAMPLGAHMHNDIGCAVANTLMAVAAGRGMCREPSTALGSAPATPT